MDLGATFGISLGTDSDDSSDREFAPENEERDSADSESGGGNSSGDEGGDEEEEMEEEKESKEEGGVGGGSEGEKGDGRGEEAKTKTEEKTEGKEGKEDSPTVQRDSSETLEIAPKNIDDCTSKTESETTANTGTVSASLEPVGDSGGDKEVAEAEYNPLIVRRSNRAIKPTKDVDLYLLGAKFGIDVEGIEESGAESSDMEFAPVEDLPGIYTRVAYRIFLWGGGEI